jgi:hypothetical protein
VQNCRRCYNRRRDTPEKQILEIRNQKSEIRITPKGINSLNLFSSI